MEHMENMKARGPKVFQWLEGKLQEKGVSSDRLEDLQTPEGTEVLERFAEEIKKLEDLRIQERTIGTFRAMQYEKKATLSSEEIIHGMESRGFAPARLSELVALKNSGEPIPLPVIAFGDIETKDDGTRYAKVLRPDGEIRPFLFTSRFSSDSYLFLIQ